MKVTVYLVTMFPIFTVNSLRWSPGCLPCPCWAAGAGRRISRLGILGGCFLIWLAVGCDARAQEAPDDSADLRARCVAILQQAVTDESPAVKIRAAEALLWNNYDQGVKDIFAGEESSGQVGVLQVLVQATPAKSNTKSERKTLTHQIVEAFIDAEGAASTRAAEALVKLGFAEQRDRLQGLAARSRGVRQVDALWVLAAGGKPEDKMALAALLESPHIKVRAAVALALRHLNNVPAQVGSALANALANEPSDSEARLLLLSAVCVHGAEAEADAAAAKVKLLAYMRDGTSQEKVEACEALAAAAGPSDVPLLARLLEDTQVEVRMVAANALLRIERRQFRGLQWPDWVVVALYAAVMVGIGLYYSARQTSTEEYFLGSRRMGSFVIAISIYATLLSTISYLSIPGEITKHGPANVLFSMLALPITIVVTGYALIPVFMKLPLTSAYEMLEGRLGLAARLAAAIIFILTRLVWMALLIYLAAKAIVVMVGWPESATPVVVMVAGLIAVLYTALGGLRAVVITDVVQFFVLLVGAIVTVVFVSIDLGPGAWVPTSWESHWDVAPLFSWNPTVRVTIIGAIVATATWSIFTYGADQVAIQRYLATRDVKAARRALYINCSMSVVVGVSLSAVGFAILSFFRANPHAIADGKNIFADADFLFPHYVANYLPMGVAGMVIAAMFAAAMSSLDSGINSIVTVVFTDFVGRFRKDRDKRRPSLRLAKYLVLSVGVAVVLLSAPVGNVPGNITEVTNKTNGLFVAPLFGLFFMCLFVPVATPFGAIVGAIYGFAFAFVWAFWDVMTGGAMLSFQWIYLLPFLVQVLVGTAMSLLPMRGKPALLQTALGLVILAPIPIVIRMICNVE